MEDGGFRLRSRTRSTALWPHPQPVWGKPHTLQPSPQSAFKSSSLKPLQESGSSEREPPVFLAQPCINLSLLQTDWRFHLFSLTVCQTHELMFHSVINIPSLPKINKSEGIPQAIIALGTWHPGLCSVTRSTPPTLDQGPCLKQQNSPGRNGWTQSQVLTRCDM